MKRLWTVYEFELLSYMKNKSFMISTIILAVREVNVNTEVLESRSL